MTTSKNSHDSESEPHLTSDTLLASVAGTQKMVEEAVTSGTLLTDNSFVTTSWSAAERKTVGDKLDKLTPLIKQAVADRVGRIFHIGDVTVMAYSEWAPAWWYNFKHKAGVHLSHEAWLLDDDMVLLDQWKECRICGWKS